MPGHGRHLPSLEPTIGLEPIACGLRNRRSSRRAPPARGDAGVNRTRSLRFCGPRPSHLATASSWCAPSDLNRAFPDQESGAIPRLLGAHVLAYRAGGGARTRTLQLKGLPLCRSSSAGVARDRGVEPRHSGAKTRRRPGWLIPIVVPSPRVKRGTRSSDDRMIFVSTRGYERDRFHPIAPGRMSEIPIPALISRSNQHQVVLDTRFDYAVNGTAHTRYS